MNVQWIPTPELENTPVETALRSFHGLWCAPYFPCGFFDIINCNGSVPAFVTAIIASVPALCTSFQKITDFRGRAMWYYLKAVHMQDLLLNAKYGNISTQEGAKRWGEIEKAFEERWPKFVRGGTPSPEGEPPPGVGKI